MINPKIIGMMLIVAAAASALVATQNAVATICPPMCADIDEEEDVQAGNTTMMTNQTAGGNMTGETNSTS